MSPGRSRQIPDQRQWATDAAGFTCRIPARWFGALRDLRESLDAVDVPIVMFACSDHSDAPDSLSVAERTRYDVVQIPRWEVPPAGTAGNGVAASLELAVMTEDIRHIIVCGHADCQMLPMQDERHASVAGPEPVRNRRVLTDVAAPPIGRIRDASRHQFVLQQHTLRQLERLATYECVRAGLQEGRLKLHAWFANDQSGRVAIYAPAADRFVPSSKASQRPV